ncbi:MAG: hypothetical protein KDD94_01905 [Calditrichaeota bacterium]|nr:hypothetical protein [Calditrichota bacterium]
MIIFWGTFENIITFTVQVDLTFLALAASTIFYFRRKQPDIERPYKTHGYPLVPIIFIGISVTIVIISSIQYVYQAIAAIVFLVIGYLVYLYFKRSNS